MTRKGAALRPRPCFHLSTNTPGGAAKATGGRAPSPPPYPMIALNVALGRITAASFFGSG